MDVKSIVKVMNFHSLLRVDKSRKVAQKYFLVEQELRGMIASISNNRNFILDKKIMKSDASKPKLNIYIGSDLGFCGGYNYVVNINCKADDDSEKIIIGKKIWKNMKNVIIEMNNNDYQENPKEISNFIIDAIKNNKYSEINVMYNRYINASQIEWTASRLFPLDTTSKEFRETYTEDFVCESDLDALLVSLIATYVDYELQIIVKNSFASENIMRQNSTNESLKKIDEIEEEKSYARYKEKVAKSSQKTIENFAKLKSSEVN